MVLPSRKLMREHEPQEKKKMPVNLVPYAGIIRIRFAGNSQYFCPDLQLICISTTGKRHPDKMVAV
jgi:hypothetical protein